MKRVTILRIDIEKQRDALILPLMTQSFLELKVTVYLSHLDLPPRTQAFRLSTAGQKCLNVWNPKAGKKIPVVGATMTRAAHWTKADY